MLRYLSFKYIIDCKTASYASIHDIHIENLSILHKCILQFNHGDIFIYNLHHLRYFKCVLHYYIISHLLEGVKTVFCEVNCNLNNVESIPYNTTLWFYVVYLTAKDV